MQSARLRQSRAALEWAPLIRSAVVFLAIFIPGASIFTWLGGGPADGAPDLADASGNLTGQIFILSVFVSSVFVARMYGVSLKILTLVLLPAALVVIWVLLSYTWSEYPPLTMRRSVRLCIEILSGTLLGLSFQSENELERALFRSFFTIFLLDVVSLAFPSRSFSLGSFEGVHLFKNEAGMFFFLALPIFGATLLRSSSSISRVCAAFGLGVGAILLVLTFAKSAIGCSLLALFLTAMARVTTARNVYGRVIFPLCCGFGGVILTMVAFELGSSKVVGLLVGDPTLTGRDQLWHYVLLKSERVSMQGVGYGALWQVGPDVQAGLKASGSGWIAVQAHNGYIDIFGQLGYVGEILLIIYLVLTFSRLIRCASLLAVRRYFGLVDYAIYIFWGMVIYNITESSFFRAGHVLWFIFLVVTAFGASQLFRNPARSSQSLLNRSYQVRSPVGRRKVMPSPLRKTLN
jgi:exopolysaccharide production protein ExoQ